MSEDADLAHDYAAIVNAMIRVAKAHGLEDRGSDHGLACYQMLEAAISDAAVWEVPLAEIGLAGFDTNALLSRKKPVRLATDGKPSPVTADWRHYWSIMYNMVQVAHRGLEKPGSGYALACHQVLAAAITQARALQVPLAAIELEGFAVGDPFGVRKMPQPA